MTLRRKIFSLVLLTWTLGVTVKRALRAPNDFAEAHWLLSYEFGFVKRGLPGELLSLLTGALGVPITQGMILALASLIFLVWCFVLLGVCARILRGSAWSPGALLTCLVFVSSPFLVMSAHLNGYYDNLVMMSGLGSVALLLGGRPWAAVGLQCLTLLVHENALVLNLPALGLAWLLTSSQARLKGEARPSLWILGVPLLAWGALAASQALFKPGEFMAGFSQHLATYPFIEKGYHKLVPQWIARSFSEYYAIQASGFGARLLLGPMHLLVMPVVVALLAWGVDSRRLREVSLEVALLVGVALAPQLMHLAAWDTARIWTYSIYCAFVGVWIYAERTPGQQESAGPRLLGLFVLLLNVLQTTPLMDEEVEALSLSARLLLYAPALVGALVMLATDDRPDGGDLLSVQGVALEKVLLPEGVEWDSPPPPPRPEAPGPTSLGADGPQAG